MPYLGNFVYTMEDELILQIDAALGKFPPWSPLWFHRTPPDKKAISPQEANE